MNVRTLLNRLAVVLEPLDPSESELEEDEESRRSGISHVTFTQVTGKGREARS